MSCAGSIGGPFLACRGAARSGSPSPRLIPLGSTNGSHAWAQYKPDPERGGWSPWAIQVIEFAGGRVVECTFFLDTDALFPLYGLPARLD